MSYDRFGAVVWFLVLAVLVCTRGSFSPFLPLLVVTVLRMLHLAGGGGDDSAGALQPTHPGKRAGTSLCTCLYTQNIHKRQVHFQSLNFSIIVSRSHEKCQPSHPGHHLGGIFCSRCFPSPH